LARAGSKGLPGKNFKKINDIPLIEYTFKAAKKSKYLDDVVLSSDCKNCINIATSNDIEVPYIRPDFLSADSTPSSDVIIHMLDYLSGLERTYDYVVLLEPTSPLREYEDIDIALEKIVKFKCQSLVSICKVEDQHPSFLFSFNDKSMLKTFSGREFKSLRRQEVSDLYFLEGTIYIAKVESFKKFKSFITEETLGFIVPKWKSFEIDDYVDYLCVESILKNLNSIKKS